MSRAIEGTAGSAGWASGAGAGTEVSDPPDDDPGGPSVPLGGMVGVADASAPGVGDGDGRDGDGPV
jgi:hypothetical protein